MADIPSVDPWATSPLLSLPHEASGGVLHGQPWWQGDTVHTSLRNMAKHTFLQENFMMKERTQIHSVGNSLKTTLEMERLCQLRQPSGC
jgi:hypothetical protein